MSFLPKDTIKVIAESIGIENLSNEIASAMAPDVEYRVREIAQEAIKFMRHSKRQKLTTEDVNNALRLRNVEALYGFSSEPLRFARAAGSKELFFIDDNKELDFDSLLASPIPKCPRETVLTAHWLAIEGIQPAVPQNPTLHPPEATNKRKRQNNGQVAVKPSVKHVLSKELQLYYEKITKAIKSTEREKLTGAVLQSLSTDPGVHQLLPYFSQFISDEVTHNLRDLALLKALMRMVRALLESPHHNCEPYLHQLIPPVLTCLVGRRLCENPTDDHWELRDFSANIIALICSRYGTAYRSLQPRITKTLLDALLDLSKPLTTHYGAIVGLSSLGHYVIQLLVLPNVKTYIKLLEPELNSVIPIKRMEARKCFEALLKAAGIFLHQTSAIYQLQTPRQGKTELPGPADLLQKLLPDLAQHYMELFEIFGESLTAYVCGSNSLVQAFL